MKLASRLLPRVSILLFAVTFFSSLHVLAEPIPLKQAVELALGHSTTSAMAAADEQRAFASYHEARNQYLPQFVVGSGLGATWGYPLSLEGSAPSIVNVNSQSAVINPALRDFVHAAETDWKASTIQGKDQRLQVMQDTVLAYAELCKWQDLLKDLSQQYADALKMEQSVNQRIQEGVDSPAARNQARLTTARIYLRISQAQGAVDVLRRRLSALTGLPAASIETIPDSIPSLPEVKQEDNLPAMALGVSPSVQTADLHATALSFRARGEHRAMWPTVDFAAQYALLATFNNYQQFFQRGSFQQHNATIGVAIRFPFFSPSQRAKASAADAEALSAKKQAEAARNQVSEQTLRLQRSVEQLTAAQDVAEIEYQIAKSDLDAAQVRIDAGTATWHELEDAHAQTNERYNALQDTSFELERARITLLRATGELESWVGLKK